MSSSDYCGLRCGGPERSRLSVHIGANQHDSHPLACVGLQQSGAGSGSFADFGSSVPAVGGGEAGQRRPAKPDVQELVGDQVAWAFRQLPPSRICGRPSAEIEEDARRHQRAEALPCTLRDHTGEHIRPAD